MRSKEMKSELYKRVFFFVVLGLFGTGEIAMADKGGSRIEQVEMRATVESVNYETREVVFVGREGQRTAMIMGPEVRNLAQVKPGDQLVVTYTEGLAVAIVPPGTAKQKAITEGAARAKEGDKPGVAKMQVATVTVTIDAIDLDANTVSFTDPQGFKDTILVERPEGKAFIRELKVGDMVDITFSRAVAIAISGAK